MNPATAAIVHRLQPSAETGLNLQLAELPLESSPSLDLLLDKVSATFNTRSGRLLGSLNAASPCQGWEAGQEQFVDKTQQVAKALSQVMKEQELATTVFLLFIRSRSEQRDFLQLCWIEAQEQWSLDASLKPQPVQTLGPGALKLGLKIDYRDEGRCYGLPSRAQPVINNAFFEALGFEAASDSRTETEMLLGAFEQYCQGLDDHTVVSETRQRAYDYCNEQTSSGQTVDLQSFSAEVNQAEPEQFYEYLNRLQPEVPETVSLDQRRLRQFIRFSGTMKGISISFSEVLLGEQVVYDPGSESLLIRDLPPTLKKQLHRQMNDE